MLNYYDEIKEAIMEKLEEEEYKKIIKQAIDKDDACNELYDRFFVNDYITGNASGSYYFNSYESRKHCYQYFRDVFEALKYYGYNSKLQKFKTFVGLVEEGYLNIENMTLDYELLEEVDEDECCSILYAFEDIEELDFETLDVITRCYRLPSVLWNILDNYLD